MSFSFLHNYMQRNVKHFLSKSSTGFQYRHTTPHQQTQRNLNNYFKDAHQKWKEQHDSHVNDRLKFFLEDNIHKKKDMYYQNRYQNNYFHQNRQSEEFFQNFYKGNKQQNENNENNQQYNNNNNNNENNESNHFKYHYYRYQYRKRNQYKNNRFNFFRKEFNTTRPDETINEQLRNCKIKKQMKPVLFYIYKKHIGLFNNGYNSQNVIIQNQSTQYTSSNNENNKENKDNNNNNNKNSNGNRNYHSGRNNQFNFIFSKTFRILMPIAMTGIRKWIGRGNIFMRFGTVVLVLLGSTGVYLFLNSSESPITQRMRLLSLTPQEEFEMGQIGYEEFKKTFSSHFLPDDNHLQSLVREISTKLVVETKMDHLEWECHVINSDMVNAMVLPNGKIFVFTGLFKIVDSKDELAAILGHEIGHVFARHGAERMSMEKLGLMMLTLTRGLIGDTISGNVTALVTTNLLNLKYSRLQELEADILGLEFMTRANFNPEAALSVQKKLNEYQKSQEEVAIFNKLNFLSTHPTGDSRVEAIEKWINMYKLENENRKSKISM